MTRHTHRGRGTRGHLGAAILLSLAVPAAALAQGGLATKAEPPAAKPADLPAARDLFARHVEATGGAKAHRALTSIHTTGQFRMPSGGIDAEMHTYQHKPNKVLVTINIPGMGEVRRGFDGKVGWSIDSMSGPALIEGDELQQLVEEADFYSDLNYEKLYKSMETVDRVDFNGYSAFVVKAVTRSDNPRTIYFDAKTGLQVGQEATAQTQMGDLKSITVIEEYQQFGEIRLPAKTTITLPDVGLEQIFTITAVEFDKTPASDFKLPEEIKVLVKTRDEQPAADPAQGGKPGSGG